MKCDEAVLQNLADAGCGEDWVARTGRCPFHVRQSERMAEIREYFGR